MGVGRRVLKNTFFLSIGHFTFMATGIIWTAILARYIGPETYGMYAYAQSLIAILLLFVNFGFNWLLVRDVAQKPEVGPRYITMIIFMKITLSALVLGGFVIYGKLKGWTGDYAIIMWIVTASYFVNSIDTVLVFMFHAHQAMIYDTMSKTLRALLALGIGVAAIQMKLPFPTILIILFIVSITPIILNSYFLRRVMQKAGTKIYSRSFFENWSLRFAFQLMRKSIPFAALEFIAVIHSNVVILLLQYLTHNDTIIGDFAAAHRISSMLYIIPGMILQATSPAFAKTYTESPEHFGSIFEQSYRYMFIFTVPMALGLWVIAPEVLLLIYGSEFAQASSSLRILALNLFNSVGYVIGPAMAAMGRQTLSAAIYGGTMFSTAIMGYLAIPRWGADGACWALVIGNTVGFIIYPCLLYRWLRLRYPWSCIVKTVLASVVMAGLVYILIRYINFLVVSFIIAPPVYLIMHKVLKTLSSEDRRQLINLIPQWLVRMVPAWMLEGRS